MGMPKVRQRSLTRSGQETLIRVEKIRWLPAQTSWAAVPTLMDMWQLGKLPSMKGEGTLSMEDLWMSWVMSLPWKHTEGVISSASKQVQANRYLPPRAGSSAERPTVRI